jgi:nitronate monooxygenase
MGGAAGGALTAAVSDAGGLGLLGGGNGDRTWLARELPIVAGPTSRPWGVGFQSWAVDRGTVEWVLQYRPRAVLLPFGDPQPQPAWASQAVDLITDLPSAAEVVGWLAAGAEEALLRALGR